MRIQRELTDKNFESRWNILNILSMSTGIERKVYLGEDIRTGVLCCSFCAFTDMWNPEDKFSACVMSIWFSRRKQYAYFSPEQIAKMTRNARCWDVEFIQHEDILKWAEALTMFSDKMGAGVHAMEAQCKQPKEIVQLGDDGELR